MAGRATVRRTRVHRDVDRRHCVSALRVVAAVAVELAVFRVIEVESDRRRRIVYRIARPEFVTRRTFANVVLADRLGGRVALKAGRVRIVGRRRHAHSRSLRPMAGRAVCLAEMRLVVKFDAETPDRREGFEFLGALFFVANLTDLMRLVIELLSMAAGAGNVRREADFRRIVVALMAKQTRQVFVTRTVVLELREVDVLHRVRHRGFFDQRLVRAFVVVNRRRRLRTRSDKITAKNREERQNDRSAHEL